MFMNAESLKKYTKQDLRQTANRKILWEISMMIEKNPYMPVSYTHLTLPTN